MLDEVTIAYQELAAQGDPWARAVLLTVQLDRIEAALRGVYSIDGVTGTEAEIDEAIAECFFAIADAALTGRGKATP